jgi:hypothetical protein
MINWSLGQACDPIWLLRPSAAEADTTYNCWRTIMCFWGSHRLAARCLALSLAMSLPLAQALELGALSLAHVPARPMSSVTFSRAPAAFSVFARAVGGVAFTQTAVSTDGSDIAGLHYDAAAQDGRRLSANVRTRDGSSKRVTIDAYDWVLIPLARLVATDATGAVTLFGELQDPEQERAYRQKKAMIANYHPAVENTLLGLRLLQADMMAFESNASDLFKEKGQYILGAGETAPKDADLKANLASWKRLEAWTDRQPISYQSYITGDVDSKIQFTVTGGKLAITGQPTWHCWRTDQEKVEVLFDKASLSPDALGVVLLRRLEERTELAFRKMRAKAPRGGSTASAPSNIVLIEQAQNEAMLAVGKLILTRLSRASGGRSESDLFSKQALSRAVNAGSASDVSAVFEGVGQRLAGLQERSPQRYQKLRDEIRDFNSRVHAEIEAIPVVQMDEYSAEFSKAITRERGINPTVYQALQSSVQVAAVMRAAKKKDPEAFKALVKSVESVTVRVATPPGYQVLTPTVYPRGTS